MKHFREFKEMSVFLQAVHHFLLRSVVHIPKIIRAGTQAVGREGIVFPGKLRKAGARL